MEHLYYNAVNVAVGGEYPKLVKLAERSTSWKHAYDDLPCEIVRPDPEKEWRKLEKLGIRLILANDDGYPGLLKEIKGPPFGIYVLGKLEEAKHVPFAIVGTRRATPAGKDIARRFSRDLANVGFPIVSGLAFGIDASAHEGCLDAEGYTIAVLAGGLDDVYPHENKKLAERILAAGGAIISEYPIGSPAYAGRFLDRNRIVIGISRGVLIVEAPKRSGSLATAHHALDQNRDVFVVPGPITHGNFAGSHELIRQGATLVRYAEDILEAYEVTQSDIVLTKENGDASHKIYILSTLRDAHAPLDVDKISAMTKLEPRIVNITLALLLIEGRVKEIAGGYTI